MIIDKTRSQEIAKTVIDQALREGADEAAVEINLFNHHLTRFAQNKIIQNMEKNPVTISLGVAVGSKECALEISDFSQEKIKDLAKRCVNNARFFAENEEHLPPVAVAAIPRRNAVNEDILAMTPAQLAADVHGICNEAKTKNVDSFGTVWKFHGLKTAANSSGAMASYEWTKVGTSVTVKTQTGNGSGRDEQEVYDPALLNNRDLFLYAEKNARLSQNPRSIEPGDYTVILQPHAAAMYLTFVIPALDARMIAEGRSVLSERNNGNSEEIVGKKLFSDTVTLKSIVDDERYPVSPFNPPQSFDGYAGQGKTSGLFSALLPTENRTYIENGTVRNQIYSRYWAEKNGQQPIGHPGLISFESQKKINLEKMIQSTERGLLISSFWYIRYVDYNNLLLTGLTRDGVFLIEDGKIQYPVKNLRFNESPVVSLNNVVSVGQPQLKRFWMQQVLVPECKIDNFTFSSISDAT